MWNFWQKWKTTITQRAPKGTRTSSLALGFANWEGGIKNAAISIFSHQILYIKTNYSRSSHFDKGIIRWDTWVLHHRIVWRRRARKKEKDIMSTCPRMWCGSSTEGGNILLVWLQPSCLAERCQRWRKVLQNPPKVGIRISGFGRECFDQPPCVGALHISK